ncbi:MAG: protein kinase, partial [Planctomycetales bacterium]|nr:protein kinase [Planctomycetales bacterium]
MSVSIAEFWRLLEESHLLSGEQIARLRADFGQMKGADSQSNAKMLSECLVSRNVISRYQATVLSAGRSGPFYYGDYRVYDRIGEGRLSGCFRAIHGPTNHPVLLQFLTGAVTRDPDQWAAAANHAMRQASLVHPHVQRIFEPVDLVSFKFIAEEDLHGQSLEQRLSAGPLAPPEAARIARLCASGLDGLHQNGQSHGDIRPANIWLDRLGNVLLMRDPIHPAEAINFALPEAQDTLRLQGDYLAPELGVPDRAPSPQSDLYALGCVFYQMLTGQPPYAGGEATDKLRRHASEPVQPLEPRGVPQPLAQIAMYLMAKNPQVRYSQASLVAEHLAPFVDTAQLHFHPPAPAASLPAYEQWIRQKQSSVAASAKANPASSVKPAPSIVVTDGPKVSASSKSAPASAGIVDVTKDAGAASVGGGSASNRRGRKEMTPQKLAIILGSVAAVLIIGIVLLNLSGGGSDNPDAIANGTNGETVVASGGDALNSGGSTTTPTNFSPSNGGTANSGNSSTNGGANSTASGDSSTDAADATSAAVAEASPKREQMVVEDDNLLWASPTTGPPLNFQYVPPGGQMFLAIRPAELLASSEGGRVLESLGPAFDSLLADWEKQAGVKFADVEQLLFVLYDNGDAWPRMASVVRLSDGVPSVDLRGRWGNPSSQKVGSVEYFVGAGQAYFIPADEDDRVFVVGATEDIKEMASFGGAAPALRRDVEKLRRMSDADRHFTMLFAPNFLFIFFLNVFAAN